VSPVYSKSGGHSVQNGAAFRMHRAVICEAEDTPVASPEQTGRWAQRSQNALAVLFVVFVIGGLFRGCYV
jgi:hypothetical protein